MEDAVVLPPKKPGVVVLAIDAFQILGQYRLHGCPGKVRPRVLNSVVYLAVFAAQSPAPAAADREDSAVGDGG